MFRDEELGCILAELHLKPQLWGFSTVHQHTQGSPETAYNFLGAFAAHQGTLYIKKSDPWRALLRMQTQKLFASLKTFLCQYVTQLSHFPSLSSDLPKFCMVHTGFLHCRIYQPAWSSASPAAPARELCRLAGPLAQDVPLSVLLSDSHEQSGSEHWFSCTKQVSNPSLSHPQNYTNVCARHFALQIQTMRLLFHTQTQIHRQTLLKFFFKNI